MNRSVSSLLRNRQAPQTDGRDSQEEGGEGGKVRVVTAAFESCLIFLPSKGQGQLALLARTFGGENCLVRGSFPGVTLSIAPTAHGCRLETVRLLPWCFTLCQVWRVAWTPPGCSWKTLTHQGGEASAEPRDWPISPKLEGSAATPGLPSCTGCPSKPEGWANWETKVAAGKKGTGWGDAKVLELLTKNLEETRPLFFKRILSLQTVLDLQNNSSETACFSSVRF